MGLDEVLLRSKKDMVMIPKNQNDYYKAGAEELENPKYHCIECGNPLYSGIMISIKNDRDSSYLYGVKEPTKHWYVCISKGCSQYYKEYSILTLENSKILNEIKGLLELKVEDKKEE